MVKNVEEFENKIKNHMKNFNLIYAKSLTLFDIYRSKITSNLLKTS